MPISLPDFKEWQDHLVTIALNEFIEQEIAEAMDEQQNAAYRSLEELGADTLKRRAKIDAYNRVKNVDLDQLGDVNV